MLCIRFQRTGRSNLATFRLILAEKEWAAKGKHLEILGYYLPKHDPVVLKFNAERISYWIGKGAQPSDTTARLLKRAGVEGMDPFIRRYTKRRPEVDSPPPATSSA